VGNKVQVGDAGGLVDAVCPVVIAAIAAATAAAPVVNLKVMRLFVCSFVRCNI
jgi:hypothetical protein